MQVFKRSVLRSKPKTPYKAVIRLVEPRPQVELNPVLRRI
jgi:hypothetical protein